METNYILHIKRCEKYQKHDNLRLSSSSELATTISPWPFAIWDLYLVGVINPKSSEGHKFILVVTEYFTKCSEVMPLRSYKSS